MKAVPEVPGGPAEVDVAGQIDKKGITVRGVFGRRWWDTWEEILLLVSSGHLDLSWLVTHRLPLADAEQGAAPLT